jgi:mannuronan 5-epimerase
LSPETRSAAYGASASDYGYGHNLSADAEESGQSHLSSGAPLTRREARRLEEAARQAIATNDPHAEPGAVGTLLPTEVPADVRRPRIASRRDLRQAARQLKITKRVSRIRSTSRIGVAPVVAVLAVSAVIGGVAYAQTNANDSGQLLLKPGGSAVSGTVGSFADGQGSVTFKLPGRPAGNSVYLGVELRLAPKGDRYRAKAQITPAGAVSVGLSKVVANGSEQNLGSQQLPLKVSTGATSLKLAGSVTGGATPKLAVRAWLDGSATPMWQMSMADTAGLRTAGQVRAWGYLSSKATASMTVGFSGLAGTSGSTPVTMPTATSAPKPTTTAPKPTTTKPSTTTTTKPPSSTTTAPSNTSPTVANVLGKSGARLPISTAVPAGAVVIGPADSIASGVARTPAGGTLVLHGGTYRQAVGSVNKPVTIQAYPGERPVISGADVVKAWTASGGVWRATNWTSPFGQTQYRADEVSTNPVAGKVEQVYRDGKYLKQVANKAQISKGTFWVDPSTRQLWVGDDPNAATVEVSNRDRAMTLEKGSSGARLLGLRFTAYASPHLDNGAMVYVAGSNTTVTDSQFDHSSGAGLKIAGTNETVTHSTFSDNGAEGMTGNRNDNSLVQFNQFVRNNAENFNTLTCKGVCTIAGFKTAHSAKLKVADNAFVGNASNGYWCDLACTDGVITGNAVSGGGAGLYYEVSSRATISNNYVENTSQGGIRISGSDHVTVTDNKLHNNRWQFTVYDDARSAASDAYAQALGLSWNTTSLTIKNNTVTAGSTTQMVLAANATNQVASPQMYAGVGGNKVSGNETMVWCSANNACKAYNSLAAWKTASGLNFG